MSSCSLCLHCFLSLKFTQKLTFKLFQIRISSHQCFLFFSLLSVFARTSASAAGGPLVGECCFIVTVVCNPRLSFFLSSVVVFFPPHFPGATKRPRCLNPRSRALFSAEHHVANLGEFILAHTSEVRLYFWVSGLLAVPAAALLSLPSLSHSAPQSACRQTRPSERRAAPAPSMTSSISTTTHGTCVLIDIKVH